MNFYSAFMLGFGFTLGFLAVIIFILIILLILGYIFNWRFEKTLKPKDEA